MSPRVIIDSGPLVALINAKDMCHEWVLERLSGCSGRLLTCEAVVSEAVFLLNRVKCGAGAYVTDMVVQGGLELSFSLKDESKVVDKLMRKYADVPISLADACVLRMSELLPGHCVLSLDRHFLMYRRARNQPVPAVLPNFQDV